MRDPLEAQVVKRLAKNDAVRIIFALIVAGIGSAMIFAFMWAVNYLRTH